VTARLAVVLAAVIAAVAAGGVITGMHLGHHAPAPAPCAVPSGPALPSGDAARIRGAEYVCTDGWWVQVNHYGNTP
jgi:hypothetical protein